MTKTPAEAEAAAKRQSQHGPRVDRWLSVPGPSGYCLKAVRTCYGVGSKYLTAADAWHGAKYRHPGASAPAGAPEFWTGGSHGAGHITISAGGGWCWSTDIKRPGYFDLVHTSEISRRWGLKYEGWAEDINGVRVYKLVKPTRWTGPRRQMLEILNSADVQVAAEKRPAIRLGVKVALVALNRTPKN